LEGQFPPVDVRGVLENSFGWVSESIPKDDTKTTWIILGQPRLLAGYLQPRHKKVLKERYCVRQTVLESAAAGTLMMAEIRVYPRSLEDLLETLAMASFPVNPDLDHRTSSMHTVVRFPVYQEQEYELRDLLRGAGFVNALYELTPMAEAFDYA
jgi:hypothetical protein